MAAVEDKLDRLAAEVGTLRTEMRAEFAAVRADLSGMQRQVTLILAGFAVPLVGLLGALVAQLYV